MATYDYLCRTCDRVVEIRATISEKAAGLTPQCPSCKSEDLRRVFTTVAVRAGSASSAGSAPAPAAGGGCCGGSCGCG